MKKFAIALAVALLSTASFGAVAQTQQQCTSGCKADKEQIQKCRKDGRKECRKDADRCGDRLMQGITLTAGQQQQVDALRQSCRAERQQKKEEAKKAAKADREKSRQAYDARMRQILTPEQYAVYETNRAEAAKQLKDGRKDGRKECKGPRCDRRDSKAKCRKGARKVEESARK